MAGISGLFKNKKARPWLIGGVIVVAVLIFMMLRGGGSSQAQVVSSGPSEALQAAQLQSATQLGMAQLQSNTAAAQTAAELQAFMYGKDADLKLAELQAGAAQYALNVQGQIQMAGIDAQRSIALAQENTALFGVAAQRDVQLAGFEAQQNIAASQYSFLTSQQSYAAQREMAQIASQEKIQLAQIDAQRYGVKQQSKSNNLGTVVGGVLGVLSIFSDVRTKKNITWTGIETEKLPQNLGVQELNTYAYQYRGDWSGANWAGYMAQDLEQIGSPAVSRTSRYLTVNYDTV